MVKDYLYFSEEALEFPLDESIEIANPSKELQEEYLISNIPSVNAQIIAPEINFYIQNTQDTLSDKIKKIKKLYDIRACVYDYAQDIDYEQTVGKKLIVISSADEVDFLDEMEKDGFEVMLFSPEMITNVKGHIGDLHVSFLKEEGEKFEIICDQLVWVHMPARYTSKVGVYDMATLGKEKTLKMIRTNTGSYLYKNFFSYDSQTCQYHERRQEICGLCADVCPTGAIVKIDEKRQLQFSDIDCVGCGKCISVCPSGSLDLVSMPLDAFSAMIEYVTDSTILLLPKKVHLESLHVKLPKGVLPLVIESKETLNEAHFMTFLQTTGNPVFFYTKSLHGASLEVVNLINEIFQRRYNKQAIFTCKDEKELESALNEAQDLSECKYGIHQEGMAKREIFSARLAHLVGSDNLGKITTDGFVHYGNLDIDQDKCTLCFSCIGACNVKALSAHPEDNSLRLNPSLCTSCGYCVASCPEQDCIRVIENELSLESSYFTQNIMAQDELFKCTQCGQEFATLKSIQKIASIMAPHFKDNPKKLATLYCCAACKPKVMFNDAEEKETLQ
jgi:ferredoxin